MQADPHSSQPPEKCAADDRSPELSGRLSEDLGSTLKMGGSDEEEGEGRRDLDKSVGTDGKADKEEGGVEEEFSFACVTTEESPVTAEDAFHTDLIRPVYPLFDRSLLFRYDSEYHRDDYVLLSDADRLDLPPPARNNGAGDNNDSTAVSVHEKLYVKNRASYSSEPQGPFCYWSGKTVSEASPGSCRKSNSTGFSRLWRFRDLLLRSNSHGKHAFVYINNEAAAAEAEAEAPSSWGRQSREKEKKKAKEETAVSAHEKLYVKNRASREEAKRRSYLPYKNVGVFADVHYLTKNIHPF